MVVGIGKIKEAEDKDAKWASSKSENSTCFARGWASLKEDFFDDKGLADLFLRRAKTDFSAFTDLVKELNGCFALILKTDSRIFAAVDRIRSHPLFYGERKDSFLIDGEAQNVKDKIEADTINPYAVEEFLRSGYVSGDETLYFGIKQLRAGEAICVHRDTPEDLRRERYYTFYNKDKKTGSADRLIETLDRVLCNVFERLLKSAEGRKIVVPLSGGVDSRLIVSMLKRLGYKDVLCLSYGVPNNWETRLSRKVAEKIGYEWLYVPYSRKKWRDAYKSESWNSYFYSQDNLSSLPNGDEWIALRELKQNKSIPEDAVFVPGHTGDFITGGHLQYIFDRGNGRVTKEDLIDSILRKHYGLWPSRADLKGYLKERLVKYFDNISLESEQDIADAYEYWEWQERQAKFIVNSVRTYEFWGYEWRVPLWDSEMMDFWSRMPLNLKLGKELYLAYLNKKDGTGLFGEDLNRKRLHRRRLIGGRLRRLVEYFRGTKGIYGIKNYFVITFLNYNRRNANSILVKDYVKTVLGRESG